MKKADIMDKRESKRIHEDWWGECRTCRFWMGNRETFGNTGFDKCNNDKSDFYNQETLRSGFCKKWDSFDIDVALALLEEWDI